MVCIATVVSVCPPTKTLFQIGPSDLSLLHNTLHAFSTVYSNHNIHLCFRICAVTQTLEPPAHDTDGTRTFSYCPTDSVSVNVTCKTEGLMTALGIPPQVIIGSDHFYLANKGEVDQWRINVLWNNHTLLYYSLPLTDATRGLAISCRSENVVSQSITLQAGTNAVAVVVPCGTTI